MNSQLEHDFDDYNYKPAEEFAEEDTANSLPEFGHSLELNNSIESLPIDLPKCEICDRQFVTKKELRAHIIIHLGEPRIVLKRCSGVKTLRKKERETYWLDPETKGSLKLTLKKQQLHTTDALKLTLKKSSESEDFTVVNTCAEADRNNRYAVEVAGIKENEQMDDKQQDDDSEQQTFENIIVNEGNTFENEEDENYENEEISNPLEDNEIPSMETNEGDSGVGSDMANPLEREDQNVDDLHAVADRTSDNNRNDSVAEDTEDAEDTDALEATCRETIENLKKLGEQSSSRSLSGIGMSPRGDDDSADRPVDMAQHLQEDSPLNLLSKSPAYPVVRSPSACTPPSATDKEQRSPVSNSNFNWNHLSQDATRKSNEDEDSNRDLPLNGGSDNNIESAGLLLQNFLIEHKRRNQSERNLGNNLPIVETEYVSLERLAETVRTCRVCNEKFRDITQLDEHRSKAGHYQCNLPECSSLVLSTSIELAMHKSQVHGAPLSPHINRNSPHVSEGSPHMNRNSPHLMAAATSSGNSPHGIPMGSPNININSPMTSPHNTHSPTYNPAGHMTNSPQQSAIPPVNFEQLPAPVQQLAQQVQRMPLPNLPPGANTMIPGPNYYSQPPGRPPMYRMPGAPQGMHYPPHLTHLYSQYAPGPGAYPPMPAPPPMHPQMGQQMSRVRYPQLGPNPRAPRMPQQGPAPRLRMKRPLQPPPQHQMQQQQQQQQQQRLVDPVTKQRRMDLLLPDRNEDADCHVIAQQKRNDGLPVIQNVQGSTQQSNRNDSTIHLTDSITLSVRQPGSNPAQVQSPVGPATKKPDASAVANVLAARGITVTPAANKNKTGDPQKQTAQQQQPQQRQPPAPPPVNVQALNLNSAISIIPAQRKQQEQQQQQQQQQQPQQQAQFAVPQNKQSKQASASDVERPPRPPTVDLTQDPTPVPTPVVRRGRPSRALLTCQVCDKSFQNQEILTQHMASHRTNSKLLHKCHLCPAQYPTGQALAMHKQTYHKEVDTFGPTGGIELALPVVDLKSPQVLNRLSSLGIQSYIPLSQLSTQTGGYFGLPIITIDGARNPNTCNLGALGATSILSLGPLKHLSNRTTCTFIAEIKRKMYQRNYNHMKRVTRMIQRVMNGESEDITLPVRIL